MHPRVFAVAVVAAVLGAAAALALGTLTGLTDGDATAGGDVHGAESVFVEFKDRDRVPARIVGWDLFSDVAVVRVDPRAHALAPVPLGNSSTVVVGTPVAAIGSPFNEQSSLSVGVVS